MQNIKRVWIWVGIAVVVIAVIFAFVWKQSGKSAPQGSQTVQQSVQAIIAAGDATQCESVNTVADGTNYETVCKNNIAWNTAQQNLDINACNSLDNKLVAIADCQQAVITGLINKDKSLTVCNQFTGALNAFCVNTYWLITAAQTNNPGLCLNIAPTSSKANISCQSNVLISSVSTGTSTPNCSLFSGSVENDCTAYKSNNCQNIGSPIIQKVCQTKKNE